MTGRKAQSPKLFPREDNSSTHGMPVNRRDVFLGAIAFVGGMAPSGALARAAWGSYAFAPVSGKPGAFFNRGEMRILERTVDIIVPRTDTPGALDVGVHGFIDMMMAEWASDLRRGQFRAAVKGIDEQAQATIGRTFGVCAPTDQESLIARIDAAAYTDRPLTPYYRHLKWLTLQGYYTSEPGATKELHYEPVPGRYDPCAPLSEIGRTWAE